MSRPLEGVRVLDLTRLLPGAVCTMMLADLGADVIKVEDPNGGDYARWMPPLVNDLSAFFRMNNRNKRAMILDLKHAQGPAVLKRLVAQADVLVEGFRPGVMARFGCDAAALRAVNPRLVYCALSGWGADGPYQERSGHDLNYAALAGLTGAMETPQVFGGQVADMAGAYMAFSGVLAALLRRERTGEGAFVDASLFESSLPFVLYAWVEALLTGRGGGEGDLTGGMACYRIYKAGDGQAVALAALEPKFWTNFCTAVGRPDLISDYIAPERQRYLRIELGELFLQKTGAEWAALLEPADCCFSLVTGPGAVHQDAHIRARGMLGVGMDGAPWIRTPLRIDGVPFDVGDVPGYGQHTRAVLSEVGGYSEAEIDSLLHERVVREQ